jgi:hypothetical protein
MPNDWFKYEEKVAETLSEFVSLIFDKLKAHISFVVMPIYTGSSSRRLTVPTSLA